MKKLLLSIFGFVAMLNFAQAQCNELFISEYVEGTSNNKALELYNPTGSAISLANYRIIRHDNGNNYAEPIPTEATMNLPINISIPSKGVYVIALNLTDPNGTGQNEPINSELQAVADTLLCPGCATGTGQPRVMCFNGDDALALQKNVGGTWTNIDIFACIGERPINNQGLFNPTAGWTILPPFSSMPVGFTPPGAYFLQYWTQDKTLFRKFDVQEGVKINPDPQTFNPSVQWDSLPENTFYGLGSHECFCNALSINEIKNDLSFSSFPIPADKTIQIKANNTIKNISIVSITGTLIKEVLFTENSNNGIVSVEELSTGIYFIRIIDSKGNIKTNKFIKS